MATIKVKVFNDKNKNGIYDGTPTDSLFADKYITVKGPSPSNTCVSFKTGTNGEDAVFTLNSTGEYFVYETFSQLTGTYDNTYFDSFFAPQPLNGYTSTTPRKFRVNITTTTQNTNIEFGHCSYTKIDCNEYSYLVTNPKGPNSTDIYPSYLKSVLLASGLITDLRTYTADEKKALNALSYNNTEGLLYAATILEPYGLYRIEGAPYYTCYPLNNIINSADYTKWIPVKRYIATASSDGIIYLATEGSSTVSKINMNPFNLNYLYLTSITIPNLVNYQLADWSINSIENKIYFCADYTDNASPTNKYKNKIVQIDLSSNPITLTEIPTDNTRLKDTTNSLSNRMVGTFFTNDNFLYLLSSTGYINRVNLNTSGTRFIEYFSNAHTIESNVQGIINGDGANCQQSIVSVDFGNAPEDATLFNTAAYKSKLASNGPRHTISKDILLGNDVFPEADAIIGPTVSDNDSTTYPLDPMDKTATTYILPVSCYNNVTDSQNNPVNATLYAWLDFNTDGIFSVNECVTYNVPSIGNQTIIVTFNRLSGDSIKDNTFIRLRLTTENLKTTATGNAEDTRSLSTNGAALDGEVEDYLLCLVPPTTPSVKCIKTVNNTKAISGETITYTIKIGNYSHVPAKNVMVKDYFSDLLNDVYFVSAKYTKGGVETQLTESDLQGNINIGNLDYNEVVTFEIKVKIK